MMSLNAGQEVSEPNSLLPSPLAQCTVRSAHNKANWSPVIPCHCTTTTHVAPTLVYILVHAIFSHIIRDVDTFYIAKFSTQVHWLHDANMYDCMYIHHHGTYRVIFIIENCEGWLSRGGHSSGGRALTAQVRGLRFNPGWLPIFHSSLNTFLSLFIIHAHVHVNTVNHSTSLHTIGTHVHVHVHAIHYSQEVSYVYMYQRGLWTFP